MAESVAGGNQNHVRKVGMSPGRADFNVLPVESGLFGSISLVVFNKLARADTLRASPSVLGTVASGPGSGIAPGSGNTFPSLNPKKGDRISVLSYFL